MKYLLSLCLKQRLRLALMPTMIFLSIFSAISQPMGLCEGRFIQYPANQTVGNCFPCNTDITYRFYSEGNCDINCIFSQLIAEHGQIISMSVSNLTVVVRWDCSENYGALYTPIDNNSTCNVESGFAICPEGNGGGCSVSSQTCIKIQNTCPCIILNIQSPTGNSTEYISTLGTIERCLNTNGPVSHTVVPCPGNAPSKNNNSNLRKVGIKSGLKIYPNPSNGETTIDMPQILNSFFKELSIFDATGKLIFKETIDKNEISTKIRKLNTGLYLVKISSGDKSFTQKLVIE